MSGRISLAILWLIVVRLEGNTAAGNSGERVHIRLHMPDVVRQHTHFHKVYKHFPLPVALPQQLMPVAAPPMAKPHVSLLGYTTTASGSGGMASSVKQLMATADTPMAMSMATLKPKYGPALFDNYSQQQAAAELKATLPPTTPATVKLGSSVSSSSSGSSNSNSGSSMPLQQQQLLQQLLTSIKAAQQQRLQQQMEMEAEPETETELEPELENNELLNDNFMAALQREYLAKFAGRQQKRKKVNHLSKPQGRPRQKPQQLLSNSEEQYDDYQDEVDTRYAEPDEPNEQYLNAAKSWAELGENEDDSAAAFSGQNNALSSVPSVDDFLNEVNGNSYAPYYGSMYSQYGNTGHTGHTDSRYSEYGSTGSMYNDYDNIEPTGGSVWQATPTAAYNSYPRPTKATPIRPRPRQRARPSSTSPGQNSGKMRYVKLTTRKKRKNRIRAKRYRI